MSDRLRSDTTIDGFPIYHTGNLKDATSTSYGLITGIEKSYLDQAVSAGEMVSKYNYIITDQSQFDLIFCSGAILSNISIFLKRKSTPYLLNYAICLGSNVKILSDNATVNRNSNASRFYTDSTADTTASSDISAGSITIATASHTAFPTGSFIYIGANHYEVMSDTGTSITIYTPTKSNISSGTNIYLCVGNIHLDGWCYDGQAGINGGANGSFTEYPAFNIPYCVNSIFTLKVKNHTYSPSGSVNASAAYLGNGATLNLKISNISDCYSNSTAGAAACCLINYSSISNISYCRGYNAGACTYCNYCDITNIRYCIQDSGIITNGGGACSYCHYCNIANISYCSCLGNYGEGGGCYECDYCKITNIIGCTSAYRGGGCSSCSNCTITNVMYCIATSTGGGLSYCSGEFYGDYSGCSPNYINASEGRCWGTIGTGAPYSTTLTRGTINW